MRRTEKPDIDNGALLTIIKLLFIGFSYFLCDALLRILTRWLGYYSIYELPPSLFSVIWIGLIVVILSMFPKRIGRALYALSFFAFALFSLAQYGYYLIFGKFFFVADLQYMGEGGEYAGFVLSSLNNQFFLLALVLLVTGLISIIIFPDIKKTISKKWITRFQVLLVLLALIGNLFIPKLYQPAKEGDPGFIDSSVEYTRFTNSGFDLELAGLYQYVAKDVWRTYFKPKGNVDELIETVDSFFEKSADHPNNEMTGVLAGKNIILVQMESLDDWLLNEESAPTITRLMEEGINFENFFTCIYGSGSTFGTGFAVNTGNYQSLLGVAAYSMMQNHFTISLPNILKSLGYSCNSFHENVGTYYNRELMHKTFGYENYYCTRDYMAEEELPEDDETIVSNASCWNLLTNEKPFYDFVVTYSAHVPYSADDPLSLYASKKHPDITNEDEELKYLYSKVRLTDDFFKTLINKLEQTDLLENTVIIAYADHYCYGISNKDLVRQLSEDKGSSVLEKTPLFIWYKGCTPQQITKTCQTIDLLPTIANMFGIDIEKRVLGNDIFNPNNRGLAVFPNGTWISSETYVRNGIIISQGDMTNIEIDQTNEFVKEFYEINEAILESDYYLYIEI